MAINLTISLTDEEQALVTNLAKKHFPDATPLEVKTWAEKQAKNGLRASVLQVVQQNKEQVWEDARRTLEEETQAIVVQALIDFPPAV